MKRILLLAYVTILFCSAEGNQSVCGNENDLLTLSITNKRNISGEWATWFTASKNTTRVTNNLDVNIVRSSSLCRGNNFISVKGSIKDSSTSAANQRIHFHRNCSENAAILNNGLTMRKLKQEPATALTNRPLNDDEIFSVRFDSKNDRGYGALAIGVTTHSPESFDVPNNMFDLKTGTWMLYSNHVYRNSTLIYKDYVKTSFENGLKVGQIIGVMKSRFGALHFFLDGEDLGPAASKITDDVYAAFQVYHNALQGTIVSS